MKKLAVVFVLCILLLANTAEASPLDSISEFLAKLKLVVFQYNQRGSIGGHMGTVNYVGTASAGFTFDEYGRVDFNANGYAENEKVQVQLISQYGHYFCLTSQCGGFSNWISDKATVAPKAAPTSSPTPTQSPTPSPTPTATPTPVCNAGYTYNSAGCVPSTAPQGNQQPVKTPLQILQDFLGWLQDIFSHKVCAQVATTAQNPATSEEKTFNTPCDVPVGWIVQSS